MNEQEFLKRLREIELAYDRLVQKLILSDKDNQEQIYEQANTILNQKLEVLFLAFNAGLIPEAYLVSAQKTNKEMVAAGQTDPSDIIGDIETPEASLYATEIEELIDDSAESVKTMSRASKTYKTEVGQNVLRAKSDFKVQISRAERKIKRGVEVGRSFKEISKELEQNFKDSIDAVRDANEFMFRDAGGRRWTYDGYARMQTSTIAGNSAVDATVDQMQRVGSDIAQIPFTGTSDDSCVPFQLKYVSVSGANEGRTFRGEPLLSLPELRVPGSGIFHPHCTHFGLIVVTLTPEEEEQFTV